MKRKGINTQKTLTNNKVFAVISYINKIYIHFFFLLSWRTSTTKKTTSTPNLYVLGYLWI
jgi:hypothetical protein